MTDLSDDVLGRARVRDTAELEAYYRRLEDLEAGALWTIANKIEPWYPRPRSRPMLWRYADLRPLVLEALGLVSGDVTTDNIGTWLTDQLTTWGLWVPTVVFFLAFWLLGAIIIRGRWGVWVIFGLLVGVAAWGGHLLGQLFQAPFWEVTASEGADIVNDQLFAPLAIAAFIIGRELTIWFGAWVARRGRRMTELNVEARREYERTLEAGPQLAR